MNRYIKESVDFLKQRGFGTPEIGIILGTGLGQIIDKDLNKGDKKSFDANKSIKEAELQKAIQDAKKRKVNIKTDEKVKKALNNFNKLVFNFQKKINIDRPKGTPRIKLFKVTLDSPINSIKNFDTFNPEYKKAFLNNFNTRGYSFQVPRDIKTIPQIAELIKDPSVIKNKRYIAKVLAKSFSKPQNYYLKRMNHKSRFSYLERKAKVTSVKKLLDL